MAYVRATLVGVVTGILTAILTIVAEGYLNYTGDESFGGTSVSSGWFVPAAVLGFAIAFYVTLRRGRPRPA
jgi:hypothetical protein